MKSAPLLAAATLAVLVACSGDKPAPPEGTAPTVSPEAAMPPDTAELVTAPTAEPKAGTASTPVPVAQPKAAGAPPAAVAKSPVTAAPVTTAPVVEPTPPLPTSKPVATAAAPNEPRIDPLTGKPVYDEQCRKCHGVIGVPPKVIKAKFPGIMPFDAEFASKWTDDSVVTILMKGKGEDMKSFKDKLSPAQMAAVAAYIRTLGRKP